MSSGSNVRTIRHRLTGERRIVKTQTGWHACLSCGVTKRGTIEVTLRRGAARRFVCAECLEKMGQLKLF